MRDDIYSNCFEVNVHECESKLDMPDRLSDVASERSLKIIRTKNCLLAMLEKWKKAVDKGKVFGALLTDLSKASGCLPHELIITKLNDYGFNLPALKLMHSYLSHRIQLKVDHAYSSREEIPFGVPQGSILLTPILFNIFLSDLFLVINDTDFSSYADDNTIYDSGSSIDAVISSLQVSAEKLFQWFSNNQMN